jgi:hypothetical protein
MMNRRTLLKTVGATAGAAATVGVGLDGAAVQEADAIACGGICIGAAGVAAGAAAGWLLRDREVVGKDDPPQGLTKDALFNEIYNTATTRKSNNKSTFIDNKNIIKNAKNALYSDAKLAAIKSLNNGETKANVSSAAQSALSDFETTIKKNLLKSWNESVNEAVNLYNSAVSHPNITASDILINHYNNDPNQIEKYTKDYTMPDGSVFTTNVFSISRADDTWYCKFTPQERLNENSLSAIKYSNSNGYIKVEFTPPSGNVVYLKENKWQSLYSEIESVVTTVNNGIITWVDTVYSQVQSGELNPGELLSPAELAQLGSSEEYQLNQAQADLLALNIPTDLERTATVSLSQTSGSSTLKGTLGVTSNVTINSGDTIDPSTTTEDYYLTYDVSQAEGAWTAFNSGIDGGVLTLTEQPFQNVQYEVSTADDETATFGPGAATKNTNGNYEVDLSSQLETQITTAQAISYASTVSQTKNVTILLDETFTVQSFTDSSGSDVSSVDYTEPAQAETDSNYITAQEWQDREDKYKNLIDKYEKAAAGGGGLPGGGLLGGLPTLPGLGVVESAAAVVVGIITLNFLSD